MVYANRGLRRRQRLGCVLILRLNHLVLRRRHGFRSRDAIGLRWRDGWNVHQCVPLFARLPQIDSRLAIKGKTEEKQTGCRCDGRYGETHVYPRLL